MFEPETLGLVSGLLGAAISTGPLFYVIIFNSFFYKDGVYEHEDLKNLFLFATICCVIAHVFGLISFGFELKIEDEIEANQDELVIVPDMSTQHPFRSVNTNAVPTELHYDLHAIVVNAVHTQW